MGQHKRNAPRKRLTVAVCIPTIPGREALLRRAVTSVHAQTWRPDRILVGLDDERKGAAATRNRLLAKADTDVVAWLDDDDWLNPNHLSTCLRILHERPGVDLVYPTPIMEPRQRIGDTIRHPQCPAAVTHQGRFPVSPWGLRFCPEFADHIRRNGSFIPMTHLVRTAKALEAGGFPDGITLESGRYQGEDERYLINLLDAGAVFEHVDRATWHWYANPKSTAGRGHTPLIALPSTSRTAVAP